MLERTGVLRSEALWKNEKRDQIRSEALWKNEKRDQIRSEALWGMFTATNQTPQTHQPNNKTSPTKCPKLPPKKTLPFFGKGVRGRTFLLAQKKGSPPEKTKT
ncbi:MAG: hypothetical protein IJ165_10435 [Proteobacteria bacterium]|nr:hypothetical protein [Pseudomonadota bacterium]